MTVTFLSSGDLVADRRAEYAAALFAEGDAAAAADLYEQALELVPGWAAGWFRLGEARDKAGDRPGAVAAFERALACDASDRLGAALHLARLAGAPAPATPPAAYVRDLFDAYADRFEAHLTGTLGYRAPEAILAILIAAEPGRRYRHALDLGCGTGLMGRLLRPHVDRLAGVDLSERMLAVAAAKGDYDRLDAGDVVGALAALPEGDLDLVTAADVFCYLGDLDPVLAAAARALEAGGRLAFTVETEAGLDAPYRLRDSLRYAHGRAALTDAAARHGFRVEAIEALVLRRDRDAPVDGLAVVLVHP